MATSDSQNKWLAYRNINSRARLRLFCFPYAGGGASIFRGWAAALPTDVEVCPVQLPGRESRLREQPYQRLAALIEALVQALLPTFDLPFAFFGHSMGALISFELARTLRRQAKTGPVHLFVSGARAPHKPDSRPQLHRLDDKEFIEGIRRLEGTPEEVLQHEELMKLLVPILRADFELCETYTYEPQESLSVPISTFGGLQDKSVSRDEVEAWREQTSARYRGRMLPGDHFFLNSSRALVLEAISRDLSETMSPHATE